jgi:hypothetical protein
MVAAAGLRAETNVRVPNGFETVEMKVDNALGPVTYTPLYSVGSHIFNPTTGVVKDVKSEPWDVGVWGTPVRATDIFGRWVDIPHTLRVVMGLNVSTQAVTVASAPTQYSVKPVSVTNAIGSLKYLYTGLPGNFTFDPDTGQISGDPNTVIPNVIHTVTVKVTDKKDDASVTSAFPFVARTPDGFKYWMVGFQGTVTTGPRGYTQNLDTLVADIAFIDGNGNVLPAVDGYTYYSGFNTQEMWDGNPGTTKRDGGGSGLILGYGGATPVAKKVRLTMTGTADDLSHVMLCRSNDAGWGYTGYHQNCTGTLALPLPAGGGNRYASGEIVEVVLPEVRVP